MGGQQCSSNAAEVFWVEVLQCAEVGNSGRKAFLLPVFCIAEPKSAYEDVEGTAGIRHEAPLATMGTLVSCFVWEHCLYMTLGNTVIWFKSSHCIMNSALTGQSSSLSSATCDCGFSFHPSRIPLPPCSQPPCPVLGSIWSRSCGSPWAFTIPIFCCWVCWYHEKLFTLYKTNTIFVPWAGQRKQDTFYLLNQYSPYQVITLGAFLCQVDLQIMDSLFNLHNNKKK